MFLFAACLALLGQSGPLDAYRKLDFSQKRGKFDDACRDRIELEFGIIRAGKAGPLRAALADPKRDVRAFAATALGVLKDAASVKVLSGMVREDKDALVRGMAVQALGWLKSGKDAIAAAKSDGSRDVKFLAKVAEGHLADSIDHASEVRKAYHAGIERKEIAAVRLGRPAPDFSAFDSAGRPFRLKDALKKHKVVVLAFQLADW